MNEARATNVRAVEMHANPFWRVHEPIWRLKCPFLNRNAREPKKQAWRVTHISKQVFLTHTSNITYEDQVQGSLNKIPPTARVV